MIYMVIEGSKRQLVIFTDDNKLLLKHTVNGCSVKKLLISYGPTIKIALVEPSCSVPVQHL